MDFPNLRWLYFTDRPAPKKVRVLSFRGKLESMNIYDAMLRDDPAMAYQVTTQQLAHPNLMGDSNSLTTAARIRTNMADNPSVEGANGWSTNNGSVWTNTYDTGNAHSGTRSRKSVPVANGTTPQMGSWYGIGLSYPMSTDRITPGKSYTYSLWVKSTVANATASISIVWQTTTNTTVSGSTSAVVTLVTPNTWYRVSMTAVAPATAVRCYTGANTYMPSGNATTSDAAWIDDALFEETNVLLPYFDGSTTNTPGVTNVWTGTVNLSPSTQTEIARLYPGSMVSGPGNSLMLGEGWYAYLALQNRFNNLYTGLPFSVEMVVKFTDTTPARLSSHTNSLDGLYYDGDKIEWSVDLTSGLSASVLWNIPDLMQNYHLIGTYNESKICLYVDGVLVGEAEIPEGDTLATKASDFLFIGLGAGPIYVEAIGFYDKQLNSSQVAQHYAATRQIVTAENAVTPYGGRLFKFMDDQRDVVFRDSVVWTQEGLAANVVAGDYLQPIYDASDLSQAGTYTYSINSADLSSVTVYQGVKLEWDGDGNFVVEMSVNNGTSWAAVTNGVPPTNTIGMSAQIPPMVRITFASGRAKDLDVVRNMTATVYSSLVVDAVNDSERYILLSGTNARTSSYWAEPIEMDDGAGARIATNVHAVLQESTQTDLTNVGTVEMWIRMDSVSNTYIFDCRSVSPSNPAYLWTNGTLVLGWPATISTVYVNGVSVTNFAFTPVVGRWYHIVCVWATPFNAKIDFTTNVGAGPLNQINMMAHYEAQLTAPQVAALYASYFGVPALAISDANTIVVSETSPSAKAYVNDWSIQGAG